MTKEVRPLKTDTHRRDWEDLAILDPLYAIASWKEKRFGGWDPAAFFEIGARECRRVMDHLAQTYQLPKRRRLALDLGCGLGRVTRFLGEHFDSVIGVDIATGMIVQARELNAHVTNVTFVCGDGTDLPFHGEVFDFVYSRIALQHFPDRRSIIRAVNDVLRSLQPGGSAYLQIPSSLSFPRRIQIRRRLFHLLRLAGFSAALLYFRLGLHPIAMTAVPQEEVLAAIRAARGRSIAVEKPSLVATSYVVERP